jgi:hypothetical protein
MNSSRRQTGAHEARPEEHEENEAEIGDADDGEVDSPAARVIAPVERHRDEDLPF